MIFMQSHRTRRFIGRLDQGDRVVVALKELCLRHDIRCGEIRATGFLKDVVLDVFHHGQHRYRPVMLGPHVYQITSFAGNVSMLHSGDLVVHIHATLLPDLATGNSTLVGGRIQDADVLALEFTVDTFDDFTLMRRPDVETGFEQWVELELTPPAGRDRPKPVPAPVASPAPPRPLPRVEEKPTRPPVEAAVQASDVDDDDDDDDAESVDLQPGDILNHPRLRRCEVIHSDGERAVIRLQSGRSAELHLEVVHLDLKETNEHGNRVFDVVIRRPGR